MSTIKPKRPRFNSVGVLVASSNRIKVSLAKRFDIVARYNTTLFSVNHSSLTYNFK